MSVSLIDGWLPIVVQVVSATVVSVAVGWRSRVWRTRVLPAAVAAGAALAGIAFWYIQDQDLSDDAAPIVLWLWIALTGVTLINAVAGWRGARWWRRVASLAAVPLCALCATLAVDAWTGYLPTVASAWDRGTGASLPTQTDEAGAMEMRSRGDKPDQGILVSVEIGDDASGFKHRDELVYLPPVWFTNDLDSSLPVVIMAGGEFGHPADWPTTGEAQRTADEFASAHAGNVPVLVFVDTSGQFSNDTECVNGVRGNAADHITKDVVPFISSHFGMSRDPAHWGMVGWSAGGTCALLTTVMHPELFSAFVDIDGQPGPTAGSKEQTIARLFGGDAAAYAAFDPSTVMAAHGPYIGIAGWFSVEGDGPAVFYPPESTSTGVVSLDQIDPEDHAAVANYLCPLASSNGIPCSVVPHGGGHDFSSAGSVFSAALPWLAGRLATPTVPAIPLPGAPPA